MTKLAIKKAAVAGAVLLTALVPSASAAAMGGGTNISTANNVNASISANKSNSNNSSNTTYVNKTVNYEALSYVKYSASLTAFTNNTQNSMNQASLNAMLNKSANSEFNMPSYMNDYYN